MKTSKTKILNQLVRMVCEKEGGKSQLNAGSCREIIKVIATLFSSDLVFASTFQQYVSHVRKQKAKE
jgi:hypothetical protein